MWEPKSVIYFLALSYVGISNGFQIRVGNSFSGKKSSCSCSTPYLKYHSSLSRCLALSEESVDSEVNKNGPKVSITYCTGCRWMLRAAWMAQELLTTFQDDLGGVELIPSRPPSPGGEFIVTLNGNVIWNRKEEGRFPESKELKQKIRNVIAPTRDLGHSDLKSKKGDDASEKCLDCPSDDDEMSDDEAEHARKFFGVA